MHQRNQVCMIILEIEVNLSENLFESKNKEDIILKVTIDLENLESLVKENIENGGIANNESSNRQAIER